MKVYNNQYFIDDDNYGAYGNETEVSEGYVIAKTGSPHTVKEEDGRDISGWFPNIIVAQPVDNQPVILKGRGIFANNPCKAYMFPFTLYEDERTIIKLPKALRIQLCDPENVYVGFIDLTGKIDPIHEDKRFSAGGFGYADTHNRFGLIQCDDSEIKLFFKWFLMSPFGVTYDLKFNGSCCANSDIKGTIEPTEYELYEERIEKFNLQEIIQVVGYISYGGN